MVASQTCRPQVWRCPDGHRAARPGSRRAFRVPRTPSTGNSRKMSRPGGGHGNKTTTRVSLGFNVGGTTACGRCSDDRGRCARHPARPSAPWFVGGRARRRGAGGGGKGRGAPNPDRSKMLGHVAQTPEEDGAELPCTAHAGPARPSGMVRATPRRPAHSLGRMEVLENLRHALVRGRNVVLRKDRFHVNLLLVDNLLAREA